MVFTTRPVQKIERGIVTHSHTSSPPTMDPSSLLDELNCCICLNIYRDPVSLRCGHSFCRVCITSFLETQKSSGVHRCPRCKKQFQEEPSLQENISLRHIAERFLSTQPKKEEAGVVCTYCIHSQVPAVKTCVLCEASLCDNHVSVHCKTPDHILSDPTTFTDTRKCQVHKEILKYFCSDDNVCICVSCSLVGDHKGHQVELLAEAAVKMKESLKDDLEKLNSRKEKTEERLQVLEQSKNAVPQTVDNMKGNVATLVKNIKEQLGELEKKVLGQISALEEKALQSISDLIQKLEEEREDLTKDIAHTKEVYDMADPLQILQECEGDMEEEEGAEDTKTDDQIRSAGTLDEGWVSETFHVGFCDILNEVKKHLQVYEASGITLDANTASANVLLSNDHRSASRNNQNQQHYSSPQQFKDYAQVLSMQSLCGRCYCDFDTETSNDWIIGMSYSGVDRQGRKSWIGSNNKSWGLRKAGYTYIARSNGKEISLLGNVGRERRIRMYLDYAAGRLSFYQLGDPITHIYTFCTTFTELLHVALCVFSSSWIRIVN